MPNPLDNPEFKSQPGEKTKVVRLPKSLADAIAFLVTPVASPLALLATLNLKPNSRSLLPFAFFYPEALALLQLKLILLTSHLPVIAFPWSTPMPNLHGNPAFKSKYGEKTKVIRLPESIADVIALLLSTGCASSDILEQLQPLSQQKLSDLAETDSTLVHLPVELRLLRAIKDVAKQEGTHYLEWITNQSKKGLDLSPKVSSSSPTISEEELTALIDERFDSLQAQLAALESRLTEIETKPQQTSKATTKATKTQTSSFPRNGISSSDLAKILGRHQKTINLHRRRGNGFLTGWEPRKVKNHVGWRYFPSTTEAMKSWNDAIKSGKLSPITD